MTERPDDCTTLQMKAKLSELSLERLNIHKVRPETDADTEPSVLPAAERPVGRIVKPLE